MKQSNPLRLEEGQGNGERKVGKRSRRGGQWWERASDQDGNVELLQANQCSPVVTEQAEKNKPLFPTIYLSFIPTASRWKIHIKLFITFLGSESAEAISLSSCHKHFLWLEEKRSCFPSSHHRSHPVYCGLHIHQSGWKETGPSLLHYKFK